MSTDKVKIIVKNYATVLKKHKVPFTKIYLFGSFAEGTAKVHSDIDVAVVLNSVHSGKKYIDQKMQLWELTPKADIRIEPILLEQSELNQKTLSTMGQEIIKKGIRIE